MTSLEKDFVMEGRVAVVEALDVTSEELEIVWESDKVVDSVTLATSAEKVKEADSELVSDTDLLSACDSLSVPDDEFEDDKVSVGDLETVTSSLSLLLFDDEGSPVDVLVVEWVSECDIVLDDCGLFEMDSVMEPIDRLGEAETLRTSVFDTLLEGSFDILEEFDEELETVPESDRERSSDSEILLVPLSERLGEAVRSIVGEYVGEFSGDPLFDIVRSREVVVVGVSD